MAKKTSRKSTVKRKRKNMLVSFLQTILFLSLKYGTLAVGVFYMIEGSYFISCQLLLFAIILFSIDYIKYVIPIKLKGYKKGMLRFLNKIAPDWEDGW